MADERCTAARPDGAAATSVRVTVIAVRRVAAMAERALRGQGFTEADSVLQDALAAALIAEDALAMEQAGDELAEPMALEALRMAKEALKAADKPAPVESAPAVIPSERAPHPVILSERSESKDPSKTTADFFPQEEESDALRAAYDGSFDSGLAASAQDDAAEPAAPAAPAATPASAPAAPAPATAASAPDVILSEVEGSRAAPAFSAPTPAPAAVPAVPGPQDVSRKTSVPETLSAPEPEPASAPESMPGPEPQNVSRETSVREAPSAGAPAPARSAIELPLRPSAEAPAPADAGRHARIDLPEIAPAPAPAPQPAPVRMPAAEPVPASAPAPAPAPAAARARSERGFSIPYGPSAAEPGEDAFFAPGPQDGPDALHAAPAGAAPDRDAPAGAPAPVPARRPKAAKRVCAALAALLVALVALVGAAWWGFFDLPEPVQARIELLPDPHARQGRLNASEADVAPGSYQLVLNQVATMEAGSRTLPIAFENPEANGYASRLELALDGERVASTNMVGPGWYVEDVELARTLPQGEHELSATVYVYSGATQVNTMSANVKVRVR